eukprot:15454538-Alexandrium_andersonii.AAC.2
MGERRFQRFKQLQAASQQLEATLSNFKQLEAALGNFKHLLTPLRGGYRHPHYPESASGAMCRRHFSGGPRWQ